MVYQNSKIPNQKYTKIHVPRPSVLSAPHIFDKE